MAKDLKKLEISHNDIGEIERGNWRKFNPYNPYVDEEEKNVANDLKIDSLDDLFDDEEDFKVDTNENKKEKTSEKKDLDSEKIAPILPMETEEDEDDEYDLQKELEAKFDELFGPIDDDD